MIKREGNGNATFAKMLRDEKYLNLVITQTLTSSRERKHSERKKSFVEKSVEKS